MVITSLSLLYQLNRALPVAYFDRLGVPNLS